MVKRIRDLKNYSFDEWVSLVFAIMFIGMVVAVVLYFLGIDVLGSVKDGPSQPDECGTGPFAYPC